MADFVSKSTVKSAERKLAEPFETKAAFLTVVNTVISDNPWGCTPYTSAGETLPAVSKSTEYYSGKVVYEDAQLKNVGNVSIKAPSSTGFDTAISNTLANAALETAFGATASHDSSEDNFSVTLKCHAANGELYNVRFSRDAVSVTSYEADSILTAIETWADTIPALA